MTSAEKLSNSSSPAVAAVEGIGACGAEPRDVEPVRAAPDLLVRREADPDRRRADLRVRHQVRGGGDNDRRTPGLVVGAEQRRPRRRDDVVPDLRRERRVVGGAENRGGIVGEDDVAAVPGAVNDWLDVRARPSPATCPRAR